MKGYWIEREKNIEISWELFPELGFSMSNTCFVYYDKYADEKAAVARVNLQNTVNIGVINGVHCSEQVHSRTVWYCDLTESIYDSKYAAMNACAAVMGAIE